MSQLFFVRKPVGKYNILLPAYFRQLFGVHWDILYGVLTITSLVLLTWFAIDSSLYVLLLNTYIDLFIIFDASLSLFIRFYQSVQVVAVNRNIEALQIAVWNLFGFTVDLISCLPFLGIYIFVSRSEIYYYYLIVLLLRMLRLYTPRRQLLDKSKKKILFVLSVFIMTEHS